MQNRYFSFFLTLVLLLATSGFQRANAESAGSAESTDVTYCIDPEWMPYEALRNGKHIGISADYLQIISEISKLNFILVPTESWTDTMAAVESGKCMVTIMIDRTPSRSHFLSFSNSYIEVPNVLIGRKNMPMVQGFDGVGNRVVGVVSGFKHAEYLARYYPGILTQYVDSDLDGLRKVSDGELDLMVGSLLSVYTNINSQHLTDLQIVGFAEPFDMLSFGVNKHYQYLIPQLNNAIRAIPESRKVEIYKRWSSVKQVRQTKYGFILITVFTIVGLIALLAWRNRVTRGYKRQLNDKNEEIETLQSALLERNRTLEFLTTRDDVSGLYNRNYFLRKVEEEISRFQRFHNPCSLIAIEMNGFSDITLTEECRKECCKRIASACLSTVRDVDIAARSDTNRFVILSPQTNLEDSMKLAKRLLSHLMNSVNECNGFLIGVAELKSGYDYAKWEDEITKALAASRRVGGNRVTTSEL